MSYAEDLQTVEWQKKRLSILTRDKWTCQLCKDLGDAQLHVHHFFYIDGRRAWEYDDADLTTYCKYCHALVEINKSMKEIQSVLHVTKYKNRHEMVIYALVHTIDNKEVCAIYNYDERDKSIEFVIGVPEHIISRLQFELDLIKQQKNG